MGKSKTITVDAKRYEDHDDCLTAAADEYAAGHDLQGWDLEPRWASKEREAILLTVPSSERYIAVAVADVDSCQKLSWRALSIAPYVLAEGEDRDEVLDAAIEAAGHDDVHVEAR